VNDLQTGDPDDSVDHRRPPLRQVPPFSRTTIWIAAIAGVVLLAFAGLLYFAITPAFERSFQSCYSDLGSLVLIGSLFALLAGAAFAVIGFRRAWDAESLPSALVAFAGVALVLCAVAVMRLHALTWGSEGCHD
jgi:hypothetical protein